MKPRIRIVRGYWCVAPYRYADYCAETKKFDAALQFVALKNLQGGRVSFGQVLWERTQAAMRPGQYA